MYLNMPLLLLYIHTCLVHFVSNSIIYITGPCYLLEISWLYLPSAFFLWGLGWALSQHILLYNSLPFFFVTLYSF